MPNANSPSNILDSNPRKLLYFVVRCPMSGRKGLDLFHLRRALHVLETRLIECDTFHFKGLPPEFINLSYNHVRSACKPEKCQSHGGVFCDVNCLVRYDEFCSGRSEQTQH